MTLLSLSTYLPAGDLAKIVMATLLVAVVAPSATAVAIAGLDRRDAGSVRAGNALVVLGAGILATLVGLGLYALINR